MSDAVTTGHSPTVDKGLRSGALGFASSALVTIASVGPAAALASVVGTMIVIGGVHTPGLLVLAAIPVLFTISAFKGLNEAEPDCGTTFVWVGRALGPVLGFLSGWALFAACLVSVPGLLYVGSQYGLILIGLDDLATTAVANVAVGVLFAALLTAVCYFGVEGAARLQKFLCYVEVLMAVVLLLAVLWKVLTGDVLAGADRFDLSWFNPLGGGELGVVTTCLVLGVTAFWGWDIAFSLAEETQGRRTPGRAALVTIGVMMSLYLVAMVGVLAYAGVAFTGDNVDAILGVIGEDILGSWGATLIALAVLTSALAAAQATIISGSRVLLSMGTYGALPANFARVNRFQSPGFGTIFVGVLAATVLAVLVLSSESVLLDSLSATGLLIMFYFGMTCLSCAKQFWGTAKTSPRIMFTRVVGPVVALVVMAYAFQETVRSYLDATNSESQILGVGAVLVLSVGILLAGVVVIIVRRRRAAAFYSGQTLGQRVSRSDEPATLPD